MKQHHLVIVESGSKTRTIQKILGKEYTVIASGGHIDNLPKKELGVDVLHDFQIQYTVLPTKRQWIRNVRERIQDASTTVWLATDKDLEGERIAEAIRCQCRMKPGSFKRVYFTEITTVAIQDAFANPSSHLDTAALESQETRRVLDRLIGYQLSPLLWKRFPQNSRTPLPIGRVQAATLSLVVDRCQRHGGDLLRKWSIVGDFVGLPRAVYDDDMDHVKDVREFLTRLEGNFVARARPSTLIKTSPPPPFMTSTIQQAAFRELGMPIQKTMKVCQELYEKGHITYPRTDSCHISQTFRTEAVAFLTERYGANNIDQDEGVNNRKQGRKNAQEAHEAIRPTSCWLEELSSDEQKNRDHPRLYRLIWKRAMASLMRPAEYEETKIEICDASFLKNNNRDCGAFRCAPRCLVFPGYLLLSSPCEINCKKEYPAEKWTVCCGSGGIEAREKFQEPPPRYDEASLVRRMEEEGIGRPATYQQSIDKLVEKRYIEKRATEGVLKTIHVLQWKDPRSDILDQEVQVRVGTEPSNRFSSTELGNRVYTFLAEHFPDIVSVSFTKHMETKLDEVQRGCNTRLSILHDFYKSWEPLLTTAIASLQPKKNQKKARPLKEIKIGRRIYRIFGGPYGPYMKFKDPSSNRVKNIGLIHYLQWKGSTDGLETFGQDDVALLTSLPLRVKDNLVIEYGRYGFYCRADKTLTPEQIRALLLPSLVVFP
jgi:DNA topoisomerase-1